MPFFRRRGRVVLCALSLLLLLWPAGDAESRRRPRKRGRKPRPAKLIRSDTVKAGQVGAWRSGPGDSFKALEPLAAGTGVDVIELRGRWARIRAGATEGWILRRHLSGYKNSEDSARTKGGQREWGGQENSSAFGVTIASESVQLRADASDDAPSLGPVLRGARFTVLGRSQNRRWLQLRGDGGVTGWVESDQVQSNTMADVDGEARKKTELDVGALAPSWQRASLSRWQLDTRVGVGYRSISMDFSSAGSGVLANTITESQAMAAEGEADLVWRTPGRRIQVGLDARFRTSYAKPGIEVIRGDMSVGDVEFTMHEAQGGFRGGVILGDVEIAARVGARYDIFYTREVDNAGLLPRESLAALVAGARLDWYRLAPDVVFRVSAATLIASRHKQTRGLEDGEETEVRGAVGELRAAYQATPHLDVVATFQYSWTRYTWSGQSARNPDVMQSKRRDDAQNIGIGIAHRF